MRLSSALFPTASIGLLGAAIFAVASVAQAPQAPPSGGAPPHRNFPQPKNLQVLPKDMSGQQVIETMQGWAGALGVHCDYCHAAIEGKVGPNGRPELDFAADTKDEKKMARIMYSMTEDMKKNYIAKVAAIDKMEEPAAQLTCGTCHRGHEDPLPFTPPKEEHHGTAPAAHPAPGQ